MRTRKWMALLGGGAFVAQITACFGPNPDIFFTQTIVNALVANSIAALFRVVGDAGAAAALLMG